MKRIRNARRRFAHWLADVRDHLAKRIKRRRGKLHEHVEEIREEHEHGREFRMFDSITLDAIPDAPEAVAGYVNGSWPTFAEVKRRWPHAKHLSIAVTSSANAECLDVEPGDATPADAPGWVKRQRERGVKRPVIYCSLSMVLPVLKALAAAGIERHEIRLWTAHYTGTAHRCTPACGLGMPTTADATQFTDHSHGANLDESLCSPEFL